MKIVLTPVDETSIDAIVIEDEVFAVGRREAPFNTQPTEKAERLSRRHARLFFENGCPYVADLGSTNGTLHNHVLLNNQAAELADGDELDFAGEFRFKVTIERDIADDRTVVAQAPPVEVRLMPSKPAGVLPITVRRFPFLITRNDPVFSAADADEIGQISRKHAVIMLKRGAPFVEDLDSANGSFVNGQRLDERVVQLGSGDVLSLGSGVEFTVFVDEVDDGRTIVAPAASPIATPAPVQPADDQVPASAGEAAAGRDAAQPDSETEPPPAADVADDSAQEAAAQSIELESRTAPEPQPEPEPELESEPESAPGPEKEPAPQTESQPAPDAGSEPAGLDLDGTRVVESGTSFLELFLEDGEDNVQDAPSPAVSAPPTALGQALGGQSLFSARVLWSMAAAVVLVGSVWGYVYWSESAERALRTCIEDGRYLACAERAADQLAGGVRNAEVERLGEQALIQGLIETWKPRLDAGDFSMAQAELADAASRFAALPGTADVVALLEWITRATRQRMQSSDGTVSWFEDEGSGVGEIVSTWTGNEALFSRLMLQMTEYSSEFRAVQTQAMSDLRALREADSVYGKALSDAKQSLYQKLEAGAVDEARAEAEGFGQQYTQVLGSAALLSSLDQVAAVAGAYEARDLLALSDGYAGLDVQVPVVRRGVDAWYARVGPQASTVETFRAASAAWRAGNADESIAQLAGITDGVWTEVAEREAARQQRVAEDFARLEAQQGGAEYKLALLEFVAGLESEDVFYQEALAAPMAEYAVAIGGEIDAQFQRADALWQDYRDGGGISAIMRVESTISQGFAAQAERLREAYEIVVRSMALVATTAAAVSPSRTRLAEDVRSEAARQHRWLEDLRAVLPPDTLARKIAALPKLQEEER